MELKKRNYKNSSKRTLIGCSFIVTLILSLILSTNVNVFNVSAAPPSSTGIVISTPSDGGTVSSNILIQGTYSEAYGIVISFNGEQFYDVSMMSDPSAVESGTWSYSWNISNYSGSTQIIVRGFDVSTRYFTWAAPITVNVNNNSASVPVVTISNPADGASVSGTVPITIQATNVNPISSVQVKINGGSWQNAEVSGSDWVYSWNTTGLGNITSSIEARATSLDRIGYSTTTYAKVGTGTNEPKLTRHSDRAVWVWEPATINLLENQGNRLILNSFLRDNSVSLQGGNTLYLYADQYDGGFPLLDNPQQYRSLISWAHTNGYYVHALIGSSFYNAPWWAYTAYHQKSVALVENIINYNLGSTSAERFDGINIDIEPHGLPDWVTGSPSVQLQYLNMLQKMKNRINLSGQDIMFGPAIPRWLDKNSECSRINFNGAIKNCMQHVVDISDYISIMDYRDEAGGPSGIIVHAADEISYANSTGKSVVIGVETDNISASGDPEKISFYEEGRDWLEQELALVYSNFASSPSFKGTAIHHYDSWRGLPTIWSPSGLLWSPPGTDLTAPSQVTGLTATNYDFQRNDLHWNRASDNNEVAKYKIYRSTTDGFTPSAGNLAASTVFNFYKDKGLLANTTYYYRIKAIDAYGNEGSASSQIAQATPTGGGSPMHIESINMTYGGTASMTIKVVNAAGNPIDGATVQGNFSAAAGNKTYGKTNTSGQLSSNSETISQSSGTIEWIPERIIAPGYYWAKSNDVVSIGSVSW